MTRHSNRNNHIADTNKCNCACELSLLKDIVSSLQASVPLLKYSLFASDKVRCELNNYTKTTVTLIDIKTKITQCSDSLKKVAMHLKKTMRNLISALTERRVRSPSTLSRSTI